MEAIAAGCTPLVPDRLSYRELIDESFRYQTDINCPEKEADFAVEKLISIRASKLFNANLSSSLKKYAWSELLVLYRNTIKHLSQRAPT